MATPGQEDIWNPDERAIEVIWTVGGAGTQRSLTVFHPLAPFRAIKAAAGEDDFQTLAMDYLTSGPITRILKDRNPRTGDAGSLLDSAIRERLFAWAPTAPIGAETGSMSFTSPRFTFRDAEKSTCETRMLLACEASGPNYHHSGYGLGISFHARQLTSQFEFRITGFRANLPPAGTPLLAAVDASAFESEGRNLRESELPRLATEQGLDPKSI